MSGPTPLIGVDTGGTFTDFVTVDARGVRVHKRASTPDDPARAVLAGLSHLLEGGAAQVVHGSTVATNALLERRGAKVVLVTTAGFEDVLEIGRQARSAIYDLNVSRPPPLVPAERRLGVVERVGPGGEVLVALEGEEIRRVAAEVRALEPEAVVICLLHAYANPAHEEALLRAFEPLAGVHLSASHEVLPELREYERCSTTVVNGYVGPVMGRYLSRLAAELDGTEVRIMQSNGGVLSLPAAQRHAVQTILSGPAGGAVGGFEVARRAGFDRVITFDMGGTSTDVGLCPGHLTHTSEAVIGETPIRVPVLDVHTVGAGGGSIARLERGGALRVGPRSAGAAPGPICYGRGGRELTVTDANLYLGRLSARHFLGGEQELDVDPVRQAVRRLAGELGLSPAAAAEGVVRVADATMERAIRVISMERGHDPRDFTLVCFGGAGAMHAAALARSLGIPRVLVPRGAGTLSALGMLFADAVRDYSQTVLSPGARREPQHLEDAFSRLEERARRESRQERWPTQELVLERSVEMRYVGQGYELRLPMSADLAADFHALHRRRYGYADRGRPVEIVNVRLRAVGRTEKPPLTEDEPGDPDASDAVIGGGAMVFDGLERPGAVVDRTRLKPGHRFDGPALVVEYSTTTVVPPDARVRVDRWHNLILEGMGGTS